MSSKYMQNYQNLLQTNRLQPRGQKSQEGCSYKASYNCSIFQLPLTRRQLSVVHHKTVVNYSRILFKLIKLLCKSVKLN